MRETVKARWLNDLAFETEVDGHKVYMDSSLEHGGKNTGPRPKPLMMVALAGCTEIEKTGAGSIGCLELLQKADVVFEIKTKVPDLVFEHGNPLNTHAKGVTGIFR